MLMLDAIPSYPNHANAGVVELRQDRVFDFGAPDERCYGTAPIFVAR